MERAAEKGVPAANLIHQRIRHHIRPLIRNYTAQTPQAPHQVHAGEGHERRSFLGPHHLSCPGRATPIKAVIVSLLVVFRAGNGQVQHVLFRHLQAAGLDTVAFGGARAQGRRPVMPRSRRSFTVLRVRATPNSVPYLACPTPSLQPGDSCACNTANNVLSTSIRCACIRSNNPYVWIWDVRLHRLPILLKKHIIWLLAPRVVPSHVPAIPLAVIKEHFQQSADGVNDVLLLSAILTAVKRYSSTAADGGRGSVPGGSVPAAVIKLGHLMKLL